MRDLDVKVCGAYRQAGVEGVISLLEPLVAEGDAHACYWRGCMELLRGGDAGRSRALFERAARLGHADALFRLAGFLDGAAEDDALVRAAESGSIGAQALVGVNYATGEWGLGKDLVKAFRSYLAGARAGDASCQYEVGLMLVHGEGCERDVAHGLGWLLQSAGSGCQDALRALALLFETGTPGLNPHPQLAAMFEYGHERMAAGLEEADPLEELRDFLSPDPPIEA